MKPKISNKNQKSAGFTLIELLAIIAIMIVIASSVIINFSGQRESRSLTIARNETITNLRKVQAYTLSSRTLPSGNGAKFYIASFTAGASGYEIYGIYSSGNNYAAELVEQIDFSGDVLVSDLTVGACMQVIFSAPFGTMYTSPSCTADLGSVLQDPIALAQLSQSAVTVTLQTLRASGSPRIFQISPLTGQIIPVDEQITTQEVDVQVDVGAEL